jgi:hypothetical protein
VGARAASKRAAVAKELAEAATTVSPLGDAKSSLGDAKSSLGDAKSSLGDVQVSEAAAAARRWMMAAPLPRLGAVGVTVVVVMAVAASLSGTRPIIPRVALPSSSSEMTLARARGAAARAVPWAGVELDVAAAEALLLHWLATKAVAMGPAHTAHVLRDVLTGPMLAEVSCTRRGR